MKLTCRRIFTNKLSKSIRKYSLLLFPYTRLSTSASGNSFSLLLLLSLLLYLHLFLTYKPDFLKFSIFIFIHVFGMYIRSIRDEFVFRKRAQNKRGRTNRSYFSWYIYYSIAFTFHHKIYQEIQHKLFNVSAEKFFKLIGVVGDSNRGHPEGSLSNSYSTEV